MSSAISRFTLQIEVVYLSLKMRRHTMSLRTLLGIILLMSGAAVQALPLDGKFFRSRFPALEKRQHRQRPGVAVGFRRQARNNLRSVRLFGQCALQLKNFFGMR